MASPFCISPRTLEPHCTHLPVYTARKRLHVCSHFPFHHSNKTPHDVARMHPLLPDCSPSNHSCSFPGAVDPETCICGFLWCSVACVPRRRVHLERSYLGWLPVRNQRCSKWDLLWRGYFGSLNHNGRLRACLKHYFLRQIKMMLKKRKIKN